MLLSAKANAGDNLMWEQAMNGLDQDDYWQACKKEINTLTEGKDAWDIVE